MASDDAGSVLKSPGAAESQRCIVGASPPRRRRDEPIAVTANHRQTKAAELKRLSGGRGRGGGRRNSSVAPPLDIRRQEIRKGTVWFPTEQSPAATPR